MNAVVAVPLIPGQMGGESVHLVDARLLHALLEVGRDFSSWLKERIDEYGFAEGEDYLRAPGATDFSPERGKNRRGRPSIDYYLTLDMAKELAMVERNERRRQARRYFIDCERQLRQLSRTRTRVPAFPVNLTRAEYQAINRQAWADVAGRTYATFHARREELLSRLNEEPATYPTILPYGFRPDWAK